MQTAHALYTSGWVLTVRDQPEEVLALRAAGRWAEAAERAQALGVQLVAPVSAYVPLRDAMLEMGMLYACPAPSSPPLPPGATPFGDTQAKTAWALFTGEREAVRSGRGPDRGIPSYKIQDKGQDWLVLPSEIEETLEVAPERTDGVWAEWLAFLRRAQALGGFRVN